MEAINYHEFKPRLRHIVLESYNTLARDYDIIVMEGAGSCCEMNLKKNDLVNLPLAQQVGASCLLVADIDKGGVFAQLIGSYKLMTRKERALTTGFLINKFRGDPRLFESGIDYIENKTGRPVFGLIPFFNDIFIDSEDSVVIQEDKHKLKPIKQNTVNIAALKLPSISNFTDLEILMHEPDVVVNFLFRPRELVNGYDLLVLPGTKNVMEDALWLERTGWKKTIKEFVKKGGRCLGICGGYQLLGEKIKDPLGVESDRKEVRGLGILPMETILKEEKIVRKVTGTCLMNGKKVTGYEIHMGKSTILRKVGKPFLRIHEPGNRRSWEDGWSLEGDRIVGTYVHGILDSPSFRGYLLNSIRRTKDLRERTAKHGRVARFHQYDRLADLFEAHCNVERIIEHILL
jgi:adenosylcobyric acid synthase